MLTALFLFLSLSVYAKEYPISDHYDGKRFFNPENHKMNSFWDIIKWQLTGDRSVWPEQVPNKNYPMVPLVDHQAVLTFINHASFLIQLPNLNVLTDPIYSERASPFSFAGPKRVREPGLPFENLPGIDVVVISHNHYDHLDLDTLKRLDEKFKPLFLVPLGDEKLLKKAGLQNVKELDWWEEVKVKNHTITFAPAHHWSARSLWDKCESLWGSYMIHGERTRIYFGGDTGYSTHFQKIQARLGPPQLALLPIGAYEPRWFMKEHHMNPDEAIRAHLDLGAHTSIGMHFGTFQLTDEAYDQPLKDLNEAREKYNVSEERFRILDQGQSWSY